MNLSLNKDKDRIFVTGASGFLGRHVLQELVNQGYKKIFCSYKSHIDFIPPKSTYSEISWVCTDLNKYFGNKNCVNHIIGKIKPNAIIHLAAKVGGIGANQKNPGKFFFENMQMGMNLIHRAKKSPSLKKFVMIGTVCSYPKNTPVPFNEEDFWNGYPEETNAPYGIAKKALMEMVRSYNVQYGFPGINLIPVNMYGPGDNFKPESSHVIPALIKKIEDSIKNYEDSISVWGTGSASREFLFVKDAAQGIVKAMEKVESSEPINLGTGEEITIKELVNKIANAMDYKGKIVWDTSKPDGQPRRCLSTSKAEQVIGWKSKTSFDDGLKETINWWRGR